MISYNMIFLLITAKYTRWNPHTTLQKRSATSHDYEAGFSFWNSKNNTIFTLAFPPFIWRLIICPDFLQFILFPFFITLRLQIARRIFLTKNSLERYHVSSAIKRLATVGVFIWCIHQIIVSGFWQHCSARNPNFLRICTSFPFFLPFLPYTYKVYATH